MVTTACRSVGYCGSIAVYPALPGASRVDLATSSNIRIFARSLAWAGLCLSGNRACSSALRIALHVFQAEPLVVVGGFYPTCPFCSAPARVSFFSLPGDRIGFTAYRYSHPKPDGEPKSLLSFPLIRNAHRQSDDVSYFGTKTRLK